MFDRRDHPSVLTCLPRPSCFSVRLGRRFSVPACTLTERRAQQPSREARSRAEPSADASLRRAWRARRALDLDGPLRAAQRLIRPGASELPLPLPTIPTARREAEAGSPSKSVTATPSIAVILLNTRDVTFQEDQSRIRHNPGVFARLRSFAYNVLRRNKISTFSQDRYAAALSGFDALTEWCFS
jgi:hypothetical protein